MQNKRVVSSMSRLVARVLSNQSHSSSLRHGTHSLKTDWPVRIRVHLERRGGQQQNPNSGMLPPANSSSTSTTTVHPMMREVTEDTPPDHLVGTMELIVTLPSKKAVRMTVNRRTPMMDLLIQVTTANKINPGGHIVQVRNERGIELPYKPSTPIGLLDTTTIDIVPKNQVNEYIIVKKQANHVNPLFEKTFRLQVHLPRNQLYVMRVGPRTVLQDILEEVCLEKNLDIEKYELRHPVNLDEKLDLNNRLGDYGLQELTIVSRNSRINSSVSSADIMALQQIEDGRLVVKGRLDSAFKYSRSSVGDSSVSSESATSGRISPSRSASDDSRSISPLPPINHPKLKMEHRTGSNIAIGGPSSSYFPKSGRVLEQSMSMDIPGKPKKRAAPAPPPGLTPTSETTTSYESLAPVRSSSIQNLKIAPRKKDPPRGPPVLPKQQSLPTTSHSRHSSDSSGYHESSNASVLSEHQEHRRAERSTSTGATTMENLPPLSKHSASISGTNLTSVSSLSSTSLTSSNGGFSRNKRKAPKPPGPSLQVQSELEEDIPSSTDTHSSSSADKVKDWNQQRSLEEVKVDVHDEKGGMESTEPEDDETETEKESLAGKKSEQTGHMTKSSSSASSLRSRTPISESGSSTRSSPVPTQENSQVPTSRETPLSTMRSDAPAQNPSAPSSVISRSSSANTQEDLTSSAAVVNATPPLPQPRTKPRTRNIATTTATLQPPIPMARPRPDREMQSLPELGNTGMTQSIVDNTTETETPVSAPPRRARNVGVKVLPDNALAGFTAFGNSESNIVKKKHENVNDDKNPKTALGVQLENDTKYGMTTMDENNEILMTQSPLGQEDDQDWDNLEENLELFEGRSSSRNNSILSTSPDSSLEDMSLNLNRKPRKVLTSISSDSKLIGRNKNRNENDNTEDDSSSTNTVSEISAVDNRTLDRDSSKKKKHEQQKSLNRWENEESLHDIERERLNSNPSKMSKTSFKKVKAHPTTSTSTNRTRDTIDRESLIPTSSTTSTSTFSSSNSFPTTSPVIKKKTTRRETSTRTKIPVHDTNEDVGEMMTSSESEASYADSGIPATANVTPSPVSLEHDHDIDRSDKDVLSIGSSRRSSIHSDHSESWREILQAKVENPRKNTEQALETMALDSDEEDKKLRDSKINSSSNFEMVRPQSSTNLGSSISTTQSPQLIPKHEDEVESSISSASDEEIKRVENEGGSSSPTRKLSKSESFTHNSEFDVKMKRKLFSANGSSSNRTTHAHGGMGGGETSGAQLKPKGKSTYLSSSDEDVSNNLRFTSMQNLSNSADTGSKGGKNFVPGRRRGNGGGRGGEEKVVRKATSVVGLQDLAPDVAAENPELRQTFQLELEAQFEEWKEQFLQRHLGGSKSASIDSTSNDELSQGKLTKTSTLGTESKLNEKTSQVKVKKESPSSTEDDVSGVSPTLVTQSNENLLPSLSQQQQKVQEDDDGGEEFDPEKPQIVHSVSGTRNLKNSGGESEKFSKSVSDKNTAPSPEVESTEDIQKNSIESEAGQTDTDMNGVEPVQRRQTKLESGNDPVYRYSGPPAIQMGTWGERPRGAISVKKDTDYIMGMGQNDAKVGKSGPTASSTSTKAQTSSPTPAITSNVNKPTVTSTPAPSKWAGIQINSTPPESNTKSAGSIVSSWKQRMQESELERKQKNVVEEKVQPAVKAPEVKIETKSWSATNTLEKPVSKPSFQISSASNTLDRPAFKKAVSVTSVSTTLSQARNNFEQPKMTIEQKPTTNGLKSTQSFQANNSFGVVKQNGSFKGNLTETATLDDKKKFFQGIKPAESPTKEVPVPAVNMKSNIATIQRVFEQRQARPGTNNSSGSTRESSPSLSTSSSSTNLSTNSSLIGQQNSSSLMLQRVMKTQSFNMDNFRRTPSPAMSSPDRFTPSPSPTPAPQTNLQTHTVVDGPVRISTKTNTVTASNGSIKNMDNKAIIIVGSDTTPSYNPSTNIFKQQLKVTGVETKSQEIPKNNSSGVKVNVNVNGTGSAGKTINITHTTPAPPEIPSQKQMIIVHRNENNNNNNNSPKPVTLKSVDSFKESASVIRRNPIPKDGATSTPPPPPPPPADMSAVKPQSLNISVKSTNGGLTNGKSATPSPMSPPPSDPRGEIFNAISTGNFKLKKTGSTVLLQ